MDPAKVGGIIRAVGAPAVAYMAAKGWFVEGDTGELLIAAITAVFTAVWSILSKRKQK